MMRKIADWFSPKRRQGIQALVASLAPLLVLFGFGTDAMWDQWLVITAVTMTSLANLLSLVNIAPGDWGAGWATARGAIYGLATGLVPPMVILGHITEDMGGLVITGAGLALGILGNVIAILTNSHEQESELLQAITELEYSEG